MKRIFLARRNALISPENLSWGVLALALVIFILLVRLLAPNIFLQAFAPVFRGADALTSTAQQLFAGFRDTATLSLQNERLLEENAALSSENSALVAKTVGLSGLLGSSSKERVAPGILAGVVARPPESPYDTLVLAAGIKEGVVLGMEVFGIGGIPLGVISSVENDFSRVILFSASSMTTHGWVGRENLPLTIQGGGGGAFSASLARAAGIAVGDIVFAPGPGALPIGTVVRIDGDSAMPEVVLRIQPALNIFSVTWVVVRDTGRTVSSAFSIATSTP
ncbi:MAG: hypothetical protein NT108_00330 [Candidatus Kaiserbacteria bacterium]|nr:hypothetical protein [Candidatus Kaiserbacteria bacterium]